MGPTNNIPSQVCEWYPVSSSDAVQLMVANTRNFLIPKGILAFLEKEVPSVFKQSKGALCWDKIVQSR